MVRRLLLLLTFGSVALMFSHFSEGSESCSFLRSDELVNFYRAEKAKQRELGSALERQFRGEIFRKTRLGWADDVTIASMCRLVYGDVDEKRLWWFWQNHFSIYWNTGDVAALLGDYADSLFRFEGMRFSEVLRWSMTHPAMLTYLDNVFNRVSGINENYARELLELHTLGVDGGYEQEDVYETARILTGLGRTPVERLGTSEPTVKGFIRDGLFQFDPRRHDEGTKVVLGHVIQPGGWSEIEQVIDLLSKHPSTAQHISRKLVTYMVADEPPPHLVASTAAVFRNTDGDLRAVVDHVLASPECTSQPMTKLKSSWEYVVSVLQTTYPDAPPADPKPVLNGLNRLGQPLFGRSTPDGYSLKGADWLTPALLLTRIEFARQMVGLAKRDGQLPKALPAYWMNRIGVDTRRQIALANGNVEKFVLLLSSPEFMLRESCLPGARVH